MANLGYLQVIRLCNQKCLFCSNPENDRVIPFEEATAFVDDFIERKYDGIIFTGGEPTLYPHLAELVRYTVQKGIAARMITNGQKTADAAFLESLYVAGLRHLHVSVHHHDPAMQAFLTGNEDSLANIEKTMENARRLGMNVDCNVTINHYNAPALPKVVQWVTERFPFIHHFVFNCLDPTTNRINDHPQSVPKLWEFEVTLYQAMRHLEKSGKTFRAERIPLCYMVEYAHCSTETRKICKDEERIVHFLDEKGMVRQSSWIHGKTESCAVCSLDEVCAGLFDMDKHYSSSELYPVFVSADEVRRKCQED